MADLTAERVRALTNYNPETGEFTWAVSKGAAKAGRPVGGKHRAKGYGDVVIDGVRCAVHRLIWFRETGEWPRFEVDHINGVRDDNRWANLRDVPAGVNRQNQRWAHRRKRAGLLGAHLTKGGRWQAAICHNYKQIHLGFFDTAEDAHQAYLAKKRELHPGCAI
jgi:hypothetical protein